MVFLSLRALTADLPAEQTSLSVRAKRVILLGMLLLVLSSTAASEITGWSPINTANGHIEIETAIAGIPGYSIIDTGAEVNAINQRFLDANGLTFETTRQRAKIGGIVGTARVPVYKSISATLFGSVTEFHNLVGVEFSDPNRQLLLGAGFLSLLICQFDYPNERMRLISRDAIDLRKSQNIDARTNRNGGSPLVRVKLNNDVSAWLVMDTGNAGGLLLERELAQSRGWLKRFAVGAGTSIGVHSSGKTDTFRLPSLEFGPYELGDVAVSVPAKGESFSIFEKQVRIGSRIPRARSAAKGLLGYDVLRHFVITIDYKEGRVHVSTQPSP